MLRDAARADWPAVLALNEKWVHFLSPMDEARLAQLAAAACTFRVIEQDGIVAAFLMGFRKGAAYDGAVFQLFDKQGDDFIYIDRIVVAVPYRGQGLADQLYDDIAAVARAAGVGRLLSEINLIPPNEGSLRFHDRRGFRETGRHESGGKTLSLREHVLAATPA